VLIVFDDDPSPLGESTSSGHSPMHQGREAERIAERPEVLDAQEPQNLSAHHPL
jgi:hypothetical protein